MYKYMLRFEQCHNRGTLKGTVTKGNIPFVTRFDALRWAETVGKPEQPSHRPWVLGMWDISPIINRDS